MLIFNMFQSHLSFTFEARPKRSLHDLNDIPFMYIGDKYVQLDCSLPWQLEMLQHCTINYS